jgi:16S rRNA (cytosine967-C5)-methyltransferase
LPRFGLEGEIAEPVCGGNPGEAMTHINGQGLSSAPRVQPWVLSLAERIIRASSREHPADGVLRAELRAQCGLSREEGGQVSRAVFAYFRWRGWLDEAKPISKQIEAALALAERYSMKPESFSEAELLARAVPGWLPTVMHATSAWVRALQAEPRLWLRARRGRGRAVAGKLGHCRAFGEGPLADALDYRGRSDLFRTREFHAGEFELQDISSQAVGLVCNPRPGEKWWDVCAGEGGKALHLADLMENQGLIWASDRAVWRLARLKRRAARAGVFNYRALVWDGGPRPPTRTAFDGVLVDAPCSGIGTWQRNPHARWTATAQDVKELSEVQTQLLLNAAAGVKPGGRLVYAACTLARLETVGVVTAFEERSPHFERLAVHNPLVPGAPPCELLFLWPQETGGNGMCVAAWVRRTG